MPTIKDVAKEADVSIATVSYVLNESGAVSEATRQRVLQTVTRLGYRPALSLRTFRPRKPDHRLFLAAGTA